jgi:hypothetical protein
MILKEALYPTHSLVDDCGSVKRDGCWMIRRGLRGRGVGVKTARKHVGAVFLRESEQRRLDSERSRKKIS